jgi:radical SAM superfamily enzyme YgiQ (UPF0313 family)
MRESGCAQVLIGLESPNESGLAGVELRSDWKRRRVPEYKEAIREIQRHGVTVNGCFILGLDGHTPEVFDEVNAFIEESELYEVQLTVMTPFPGTPLYDRLAREDRLLEPRNWKACTLFDVNYRPSHMTVEELRAGFRDLVVDVYSEARTKRRRARFRESLRAQRRTRG